MGTIVETMASGATLLASSYRCHQHIAPFRGTATHAPFGKAGHGHINRARLPCKTAREQRLFPVRNAASSEVSNPEIGVQSTGSVQAILFDMVRKTPSLLLVQDLKAL